MELNGVRPLRSQEDFGYGLTSRNPEEEQKVSTPVLKNTEVIKEEDSNVRKERTIDIEEPRAKANTDIKDISLTFHLEESFGYIGKDKDVAALDVQKAISDMQKDHILQQYQYFVGGRI